MSKREYFEYSISAQDEPCPACGAEWSNHECVHDEACAYIAWVQDEDEDE